MQSLQYNGLSNLLLKKDTSVGTVLAIALSQKKHNSLS